MNKYFAKRTKGFDSKKESKVYLDLLCLEKSGHISNLVKQPRFCLFETFKDNQNRTERGCYYTPDFGYTENGKQVVVEVKSSYTAKLSDYIIRRKLFKLKYPEIIFEEIVK